MKQKGGGKKKKGRGGAAAEEEDEMMQDLGFYVNGIAGSHTNVSVNGSKAFLPLQGNP